MEIKGKVENILAVESGTSKAGKEWRKQNFVINTGDQYNPLVCFGVFGDDKIAMVADLSVGEDVNVHFNLSSREFNGKYYHNIDAWKIEKGSGTSDSPMPTDEPSFAADEEDEMPF